MPKIVTSFAMFVVLVALVACSDSDVGESCEEEGRVRGECVDGAVCGKGGGNIGDLVCLAQCTSSGQCAGDEECNGVSGTSLKGCRKKKP